jgi:Leucine-rich repeat (LRR) protein
MEVNLDEASSDLRIASIYTTKLNLKEEKRLWWNGLTTAWRSYFGSQVVVYDTIRLSDIYYVQDSLMLVGRETPQEVPDTSSYYDIELPPERQFAVSPANLDSIYVDDREFFNKITGILKDTRIDVSGNPDIRSLAPLSELSDLTDLNCSNTLIISLSAIRNLNHLENLDISNTPIDDLSPLQYSTSLRSLDCSYTLVDDLSVIAGLYGMERFACAGVRNESADFAAEMMNMRELDLSETAIYDLTPITKLVMLEELNVSGTGIRNLETVHSFVELKYLDVEGTSISSVEPLSDLQKLEVLKISYTAVEDINPLDGISNLKRIYWDSNGEFSVDRKMKRDQAIAFMNAHPGSLVIFESEELLNGWSQLEEPWKQLARNAVNLSENPTKEELHALLQLEEIRIDSTPVTTLAPVAQLYNLKRLSIPGLQVKDLSPLGQAIELEYLDISSTPAQSLDFAASLKKLQELNMEGTQVNDLSPLYDLPELSLVYADGSRVSDVDVRMLRDSQPACNVIYRTDQLSGWWSSLPEAWKGYFVSSFSLHSPPTKEQLHLLFYMEELQVEDNPDIATLAPLAQLVNLELIRLSKIGTGDLQPLAGLDGLRELYCMRMPVTDLSPLASLGNLEVLNIENTPVDELKPIRDLTKLREMYISGTQVKSLKPLSNLNRLEVVELNNTEVKSISHLESLPALQSLSCFNTRVSSRNIEKFKEEKPRCKVVYY